MFSKAHFHSLLKLRWISLSIVLLPERLSSSAPSGDTRKSLSDQARVMVIAVDIMKSENSIVLLLRILNCMQTHFIFQNPFYKCQTEKIKRYQTLFVQYMIQIQVYLLYLRLLNILTSWHRFSIKWFWRQDKCKHWLCCRLLVTLTGLKCKQLEEPRENDEKFCFCKRFSNAYPLT